ncbi:serotriflin-like [Lithobates pipiens]
MNLLTSLSCFSLFLILCFQELVCQEEFYTKYSCDNVDIRSFIVDKHNELRSMVQPPPANMLKMKWHPKAAENAMGWARACPTGHSKQEFRRTIDWGCGENLYFSSKLVSWLKVLLGWWDEKNDFEYGKGAVAEGKVIGHYTQFVWHKSWQLGCALHFCPQNTLSYVYVCHYCPSGNEQKRINIPYTPGQRCANCTGACTEEGLCTNYCPYEDDYDQCEELEYMCDDSEESMEEDLRVVNICKETCHCNRKTY